MFVSPYQNMKERERGERGRERERETFGSNDGKRNDDYTKANRR